VGRRPESKINNTEKEERRKEDTEAIVNWMRAVK